MSRLDHALASLARHRRECRSDDCPRCAYDEDRPAPSDADMDAWSGRWEDAQEYWRDAAVAS